MDRILIMDDNKESRQYIKGILIEKFSDIEILDSMGKAKYIGKSFFNRIQLCLIHVYKEEQVDILGKIQEDLEMKDIPIIVYSSLLKEEFILDILKLGIYDHITVSHDSDSFREKLYIKTKNAIEQSKRFQEIQYLSYHDELTGLYNKRFLEEEIIRLDTPRQLPLSIIVGDVNGLKLTNDIFGHDKGDKMLIEISRIIRESCRKEDIDARIGGDEFYIFLPKTPSELAEDVCNRIYRSCSQNKCENIPISISLGHSTKVSEFEDLIDIGKKAEDLMYNNKLTQNILHREEVLDSLIERIIKAYPELNDTSEQSREKMEKIIKNFSLTKEEEGLLYLLLLCNDIGCITIDDSILNKKGKLNDEEWSKIKEHSRMGYRIAKTFPELNQIAEYILYHHERWDGSGYPYGLKEKQIPKISRIISIIKAYDSMTNKRPHKRALNHEEAIYELLDGSGTQFDPYLVNQFINAFATIECV